MHVTVTKFWLLACARVIGEHRRPEEPQSGAQYPYRIYRKGNPRIDFLVAIIAICITDERIRTKTATATATESRKMAAILQLIG